MRERRGKERREKGPSPTCFLPAQAAPEPQCPAGASSLRRQARFAGTNPAAALAQHVGADGLRGEEASLLGKNQKSPADGSLCQGQAEAPPRGDLVLLAVLDLGL